MWSHNSWLRRGPCWEHPAEVNQQHLSMKRSLNPVCVSNKNDWVSIRGLNQDHQLNSVSVQALVQFDDEESTNYTLQRITVTIGVYIISLHIRRSHMSTNSINVWFESTMKETKAQIKPRSIVPTQFIFLMHVCEKTDRDIHQDETEEKELESIHRLKPQSCDFLPSLWLSAA